MANTAVEKLAKRLGLGSGGSGAVRYGLLESYPAQVEPVREGNTVHLRALLRFQPGKEDDVRQALASGVAAAGIEPRRLDVREGSAGVLIRFRVLRGLPGLDVQEKQVRAVAAALQQAGAVPPDRCAECGAREQGEPVLLRGRVDRVCPSCLGRLDEESRVAQRAYLARPVNLAGAALAALLGAALGAVAYGGIIVATGRMLWIIPIGTGALVAWAAIRGAGRTSVVVQVIAGVATLLSVVAGLLGYVGWEVHQNLAAQGHEVDWLRFLAASPRILVDCGSDAAFSIGGGLIGAWGAASRLKAPEFGKVSQA
ncbi:MAG TPA: hypothetical protein VML50_08225 [Anaeromyxobacter sp.]|nr:hypothetical protein [Anaeromyxobacter sp.]